MIKTNKLFKKILCAVTAGTLALTAIMPVTFAEGETTETKQKEVEFVNATVHNGAVTGTTDYYTNTNNLAEIKEDGSTYVTVNAAAQDKVVLMMTAGNTAIEDVKNNSDKFVLSFDVKTEEGMTAAVIRFYETNSNRRLGFFRIDAESIGVSNNGTDSGYTLNKYAVTPGEWNKIEYVVYNLNAPGELSNKIICYVNGEEVMTCKYVNNTTENRSFARLYCYDGKGLTYDNVNLTAYKFANAAEGEAVDYSVSARVNEDGNIIADFTDEVENTLRFKGIKVMAEDGTKIDRTITLSDDGKSMTIVPAEKLGSFTVKFPERFVSKNGLVLKENTVKADGFQPVQIVKENGTAYAKTELLNTAATEKKVNIALASYKTANNGLEMLGYTTKTVTIPANSKTVVDTTGDNAVSLTVAEGAAIVKGFMWDGTANTALKDATIDGTNVNNIPESTGFVQLGASEMTIADDFGADNANGDVTVVVSDKENNVVYADQVKADGNGKAGLHFSVDGEFLSKELSAVMVPSAGEKKTYSLSYKNASLYDNAANEINTAITDDSKTETEVIDIIKATLATDYSYFGVDKALFDGANTEEAAKLIYNEFTKDENSSLPVFGTEANFDNMESGAGLIKKLFIMTAVGDKGVSDLFDYSEELELKNDQNYDWYTKDFVSKEVKSDITSRMAKENITALVPNAKAVKSGNYATQDQFFNALKNAYILSVVKRPDGEDNLKDVLSHFEADGTLDIPATLKLSTLTGIKSKNYTTLSALENAIDTLENSSNGGGSTGSGNGGGSGSGSNKGNSGSGSSMVFGGGTTVAPAPEKVPETIYTDMDGYDWAEQAIIYLTEKRVVNGKNDKEFAPADLITREEFAAMLVRAFAKDIEAADVSFTDADKDEWYNEYLGKAVAAGFVNGYDDGRFGVGENITRQDMVVMTSRAAKYAGIMLSGGAYTTFGDDSDIADYAKDAVYEMRTAGIVNGVSERQFAPLENAERAQAAKVVFELLNV